MALGNKADIKDQDAAEIIERAETAIGNWGSHAADHNVGGASSEMIAASLAKVAL